ncbi:MAG: tRNA pseudouridine(13) synthase TruD [Planctomycetota bacterium]
MLHQTSVPRLCSEPPIRGVFGAHPDDFIVEEILAYEPSGSGAHIYLWIEKKDITTFDAVRRIARFLDRPTHAFGMAGLKDRNAVTRQWLSIEHVEIERLRGWTIDDVSILRAERHGHKLRIGHARGNRFILNLRNVPAGDLGRTQKIVDTILRNGLPNAYDSQRFGRGGVSLQLGLALIHHNFELFTKLNGGRPAEHTERRLRSLLISAVQSELFNRVLAARIGALGTLHNGDIATIHKNGAAFVVEDAAVEQPRADVFEISPAGPMLGSKLLQGFGAPRELEDRVFAEAQLSAELFKQLPLGHEARGARRPLRVPLADFRMRVENENVQFAFSLPSGSYATRFVYELLGGDVLRNDKNDRNDITENPNHPELHDDE